MSFQPVIPTGGYAGWTFLGNTIVKQKAAFGSSAQLQRETDYFRANIGKITSVDQLVGDRKLLTVALGAFGLSKEINSTYLIKKVLSEGSTAPTALANKLSDKRYLQLAKAFGFGDGGAPATQTAGFADRIIKAYDDAQFNAAVGQQDANIGLALTLKDTIGALTGSKATEATKWYSVMGNTSMRKVFETALGLPATFATVPIDTQLTVFENKAQAVFGDSSVSQFSDPAKVEKLVRLFLVRAQAQGGAAAGVAQSPALQLLQGASGGQGTVSSPALSLLR